MQATAITQFQVHPNDFATEVAKEVLRQLSGTHPAGTAAIPVEQLPDQSATQAAKYLGCAPTTLEKIVQRHPEHLRPVVEAGKATRYRFSELFYIKSNNLVK